MGHKKPNELTPTEFENGKFSEPKTVAAGIPAVFSAVRHLLDEMDPVRATKVMFELNQKGGVDCPGCAWPDPDGKRSSLGEYCENGAKAIAEEATTKGLDSRFFQENSIDDLASQTDYWIGKRGRILQPVILEEGANHYQPITWDNAFNLIANELNALPSPDDAVFYTSGRTSNEAAFMYQLFVRMFGTNNLPDCSNMCHESSGVALSETVGIGKGSVTLDDFNEAEVILVIGQNPGTNHPRMLSALKKAKLRGAKIITINLLPEAGIIKFKDPQSVSDVMGGGVSLTDLFLQVRINGDVPLMKAILKRLLELERKSPGSVFDQAFIESKTAGYQDLCDDLDRYHFSNLCEESGVQQAEVEAAVNLLANTDKIIACWAMGLTQHKNGIDNIQEVVNLLLAKGSIGKPGTGTCPVRGHSNVQGDRTMGIWEKPKPEFLDKLGEHFNFKPPREHGLDVVDSIKRMHENSGMVFIAMGGNFLSATPDTSYTAEALRNCMLTVHVSTKLNRSHLVTGKRALILPSLGRSDEDIQASGRQFVSVENSMGVVHSSTGKLKPLSKELLSEPAIIAGIAKATLKQNHVDWSAMVDDYDRIRDHIEAVIPGFEDYNKRVRQPSGFYLPNNARNGSFEPIGGRAKFTINELPDNALKSGELLMSTVRTHDQFNTTIYGMNDRYRGVFNERRVVLMNAQDISNQRLNKGDVVDLISNYKNVERRAPRFLVIPYSVPQGCAITYFPEANILIPIDSVAHKSNTPTSKLVKIKLEKVAL